MTDQTRLVYPIYLDVPMMTSFLASIEDGVSYGSDITKKQDKQKNAGAEAEAKAGTSGIPILSSLFNFDLRGKITENNNIGNSEEVKLIRKHTEASLFMKLRQKLEADEVIKTPLDVQDLSNIVQGDIVEIRGQIYRSPLSEALDAVVRIFGLFGIDISKLDVLDQVQHNSQGQGQQKKTLPKPQQQIPANNPVHQIFSNPDAKFALKIMERMRDDLVFSKIQDVLMKPSVAGEFQVIIALSTEFLNDTSSQTLLSGEYTLLGKVSRVLTENETVSLYQRTTLSYLDNNFMDGFINSMKQQQFIKLPENSSLVTAPLIQVIPLAIYV